MTSRNRRPLVPEAKEALDLFKAKVMADAGYPADQQHPDQVKHAVANRVGVPLTKGYNGNITAEQAGKVGGQIGGRMVREMIRLAEQQMAKKS